jgi:hypothetical protein
MNLKRVLNKTLPQAHTESELDKLGIPRKLMKIWNSLIHMKFKFKFKFSSHKLAKQQSTSFWSQGTLEINIYA